MDDKKVKKPLSHRLQYTFSFMLLILISSFNCSYAIEYDIDVFDGPDGIVNHNPSFVSGDSLNLKDNIQATTDIGALAEGKLVINGNDFVVDGMGLYSGILMDSRIYNYTINNITFQNFSNTKDTDFARGSTVFNAENGESTILNSSFVNNISSSQNGYAQGGAIYNKGVSSSAILTVVDSEFVGNESYSGATSNFENGGGAIYNAGNTVLTITNTVFKDNITKAYKYSYGGGVANVGTSKDTTVVQFSNLVFENNSSISETDTGYGGAYYNSAQTKTDSFITDSSFINNKARGVWARGGAIYNDNLGSGFINNSIFKGNSAIGSKFNTTGGAFHNQSNQKVVIRNCIFEDNLVESPTGGQGGAIYNRGTLTLMADEGFMSFKGNLSGRSGVYTSNAIYNQGTLNINVTKSGMISINDKIDASGSSGVININKAGVSTLDENADSYSLSTPDEGNIIILETISNHTINLYDGIFSLGRSNQNMVPNGNYFDNVKLNLYDGLFNIANGAVDNLTLVDMTSNGTASMYIDVDLANNLSDNFTITGTSSGNVNITGINLLSDIDRVISFDIFKNSNIKTDGMSLNVYTQNAKYEVTGSNGTITFTPDVYNAGLMGAVTDTTAQYRSFSAEMNENITSSLGNMGGGDGSMLTIFGNSLSINGNRYGGMTINDGQAVHIFSAGSSGSNNSIIESVNSFIKVTAGSDAKGGFVENNGVLDVYSSAFQNNKVVGTTDGDNALGGVIYNTKDVSLSYSVFGENTAQNGDISAGGALYNTGNASLIFVRFIDNVAESADGKALGGAVYNSGDMTIINSSFTGNKAIGDSALGGAIYNASGADLTLIASNTDFEFAGNTANGKSNAIYNEGIVNLNAGQSNKIIFNDAVQGKNKAEININYSTNDINGRPCQGEIQFNNTVSDSTLNFYSGILTPSYERNLDGNDMKFSGGLLNFVNNSIGTMALDNLVVENSPRWQLELDLENKTGDRITANNVSGDGTINITNVVLLSDTLDKDFLINIAGESIKDKINLVSRVAYTPIFQYKLFYDQPTGSIGIGNHPSAPIEGFNPAIMAAPVAAQIGSYLNQLNTYNQVFNNMDMYMLMPKKLRETIKNANKIANAPVDGGIFSPLAYREKDRAVWFKPYSTFENVPLKNGYRVSNVSYGSMFGVDGDLKQLKHGFDVMYSAYGAYNGSHQAYQGVGITQNGGLGGVTAMLYKGGFYTGLTANVGANAAEASTMYGLDNFTMLTAGVASKTGYNWELFDSKFIIQPNYLMSYSYINTFDFRNSAGVKVDSDALNAIQIAPGIRFIGNLKNGWQPYLGVNMVWNIIDKTKFKANDVSLPELSIKPFVEYGVGVQKHAGERFTGFAQAMIRNGGRNGISLQLGFRWRI